MVLGEGGVSVDKMERDYLDDTVGLEYQPAKFLFLV